MPDEDIDALAEDYSRLLVTDFDGTIAASDFFGRVLEHLSGREYPDYWGPHR